MAVTFTRVGRLPSRFDLEFIKEDVQKQRRIARALLEQAERIQRTLDENPDMENRQDLEEIVNSILRSAGELARNANDTTSTATTVITTATSAST